MTGPTFNTVPEHRPGIKSGDLEFIKNIEPLARRNIPGEASIKLDPSLSVNKARLNLLFEQYLEAQGYMRYRGTSLPTTDIRAGDTYTVGTGQVYIYNGTAWVLAEQN